MDTFLLEDGSGSLLLEDGTELLLEIQLSPSATLVVFSPVLDLGASALSQTEVSLSWTPAAPLYQPVNLGGESGNVGGVATGPPVGWTVTSGNMRVRVGESNREPPEGANIIDGGTSLLSKAYQRISPLTLGMTIDQVDDGYKEITLDWWGGNFVQTPGDLVRINLYFMDENGTLLSSYSPSYKVPTTRIGGMRWDEFQDVTAIPVGTRFIDVELEADRNAGTNNDAAFDDIRVSLEGAASLPYVPGYAIYRDGDFLGTAAANAISYLDSTAVAGTEYEYTVFPLDGSTLLSTVSNTATVTTLTDGAAEVVNQILLFDDEWFGTGYIGGKLRGNVVACPADNANGARPCC